MYEFSVFDLEFARHRVRCASAFGASVHHLVEIGMPKLSPTITRLAFYLYRLEPTPTGNKIVGPLGTGFTVARPTTSGRSYHYYGVTNRHVAHASGASIIRLNTLDGKTRNLEYEPHDWQFIPQQDDLAVVDITDDLTDRTDDISFISEHTFFSQSLVQFHEVGPGDDVFMTGLFSEVHGGERNIPALRFGNISMMATEAALIEQPHGIKRPSYLADMRSKAGFSGSPVLVYRSPENDFDRAPGAPLPLKPRSKFVALLGVHCSQFWEKTEVRKRPPRASEQIGAPVHDGDSLYIEGAMNVVVPAWRISEILDLEVFAMARKKREPALDEAASKRARPETAESNVSPSDANPTHREDFNSLLGAAVQKPERED